VALPNVADISIKILDFWRIFFVIHPNDIPFPLLFGFSRAFSHRRNVSFIFAMMGFFALHFSFLLLVFDSSMFTLNPIHELPGNEIQGLVFLLLCENYPSYDPPESVTGFNNW
jgi:hypothetical protein